MAKKKVEDSETGAWMLRDVPRDLMERMRIAAAIQRTTVKALLLQLAENHLTDLEKDPEVKILMRPFSRHRVYYRNSH